MAINGGDHDRGGAGANKLCKINDKSRQIAAVLLIN